MSVETTPQNPAEINRRKNQWKLLGIFAIAGVPVVLAMVMYFGSFAIPAGKTNKGDLLLPPLSLSAFGYKEDEQGLYPDAKGKWLLLQVGSGECDQQCMDLAHTARQVNILMAREQERVARVLIAGQTTNTEALKAEYPQLDLRSMDSNEILSLMPAGSGAEGKAPQWQIWVSDPLGNVILKYDASHSGYDLRDDLKKLLKLSNIG